MNAFVVDTGMSGFSKGRRLKKLGLKGQDTAELFFDNVKVPEENLLPKAIGLIAPMTCLTSARYGISWGA